MMQTNRTIWLTALLVASGLAVFGLTIDDGNVAVTASAAELADDGPQPVDDDMHHFMEYVFEPNYKRLQAEMAEPPKDKQAWKAIKGDALTLAECANLLLFRAPDEDAAEWQALSVAVRGDGGELYQAARNSDYPAARKAYEKMLNNCNACHKKFAEGKYQLKP